MYVQKPLLQAKTKAKFLAEYQVQQQMRKGYYLSKGCVFLPAGPGKCLMNLLLQEPMLALAPVKDARVEWLQSNKTELLY